MNRKLLPRAYATSGRTETQAYAFGLALMFNECYPIGTKLHYWSGAKQGKPSGTARIQYLASVVNDQPVTWLEGVPGCI